MPFEGLLNLASKQTQFMNAYYLSSAERLAISGLWKEGQDIKDGSFGFLFHHLPRFSQAYSEVPQVGKAPEVVTGIIDGNQEPQLDGQSEFPDFSGTEAQPQKNPNVQYEEDLIEKIKSMSLLQAESLQKEKKFPSMK